MGPYESTGRVNTPKEIFLSYRGVALCLLRVSMSDGCTPALELRLSVLGGFSRSDTVYQFTSTSPGW